MNRNQLDLIPDQLLTRSSRHGATRLIEWLHARGWRMTLHELETERQYRGLQRAALREGDR